MKVLIRADASSIIGFGHIMRCLTLADALRSSGATCAFACRALAGNATKLLEQRGYEVFVLDAQPHRRQALAEHESELSSTEDASLTIQASKKFGADRLIVDHYQLDAQWEDQVANGELPLLAIDDLANRPHSANALLDQNLGRTRADYAGLLPEASHCFLGPSYALLRPQFYREREASRRRRESATLDTIMISMGGTDASNATGDVLRTLKNDAEVLDSLQSIAVILGSEPIWLEEIQALAASMPIATNVLVGVTDMATQMRRVDLAIGAAGTTSWERCCLGVPSVIFSLAENQTEVAKRLDEFGAAVCLGRRDHQWQQLFLATLKRLQTDRSTLHEMSERAFQVTDGLGATRLCAELFGLDVRWESV